MGKKNYALKLYGEFENICDFATNEIQTSGLILNLHTGIKKLLLNGEKPFLYLQTRIEILRNCVIIGDEISSGVIPIDKFERLWREETGKIYQFLANESDIVDRVFAGIAIRLKG